ncbi:hypothetical protein [Okeania sp.]|nr:hypothetical protein [Okeania sp.]
MVNKEEKYKYAGINNNNFTNAFQLKEEQFHKFYCMKIQGKLVEEGDFFN